MINEAANLNRAQIMPLLYQALHKSKLSKFACPQDKENNDKTAYQVNRGLPKVPAPSKNLEQLAIGKHTIAATAVTNPMQSHTTSILIELLKKIRKRSELMSID